MERDLDYEIWFALSTLQNIKPLFFDDDLKHIENAIEELKQIKIKEVA